MLGVVQIIRRAGKEGRKEGRGVTGEEGRRKAGTESTPTHTEREKEPN